VSSERSATGSAKMTSRSMPSASSIAAWIEDYFRAHKERTAAVLSGPKRETWFSAETFVALCSEITPHPEDPLFPNFSCWGEQEFATVFALIEATHPLAGEPRRKPDIVCYNASMGIEAVEAVIEIKLVRNDEKPKSCLTDLKKQLTNASMLFPNAEIIGVIFFAVAPYLTPETSRKASEQLKQAIKGVFPADAGFAEISKSTVEPIFDSVPTSFHFPQMHVSLSLAVIKHNPGTGTVDS
jgi:hypothetical protein